MINLNNEKLNLVYYISCMVKALTDDYAAPSAWWWLLAETCLFVSLIKREEKLSMSFGVKSSSVITNLVHDASCVSQVRSCLERVTAGWSTTTEAWSNSTTRWETTRRCLSTTTYCPTGTGWGTGSLLWQMPWRTSTLHPSRPRKWCKLSYWLRVWAPPVPV